MEILPNSAGTGDRRIGQRHRVGHRRGGDNFEVLGCCQHLAIREFHVVDGVPDFDTRHIQVPTNRQCIKEEQLYKKLGFHSFLKYG